MYTRIVLVLLIFMVTGWHTQAQEKDTLRNLAKESSLAIDHYSGGANWGYWTGHNNLGRQQFAEKYYIEGTTKVLGVICHLTGTVTPGTQDSSAFNVWTVANNHFPGELVASKAIQNVDLDVSGNAFHVVFDEPVSVKDSFFVAFDLYDYSHHEHQDTLGILYGPDGSRAADDRFGRNVIQVHSHGTPVWRDFATQNFTNTMTHLAIFPIVEFPETVLFADSHDNPLKIYPNPTTDRFYLPSGIQVDQVAVVDMMGEIIFETNAPDDRSIEVKGWPAGSYVVRMFTRENRMIHSKLIITSGN